jgi:hypothetical protein
MKKLMILTFAAATVLAPMALAGHDDGRFRAPQANRMVVLSEDLMNATQRMSLDVRQRGAGHGRNRELVVTLDGLERQARQFRRAVLGDAGPRRLNAELDELVFAFNRADRRMRLVRSGRLQRDFDRIEQITSSLVRTTEIAMGPRDRRGRDGFRGAIEIGDDRGRGGLHGAIVLSDRDGDTRYEARIRF